MLDRRKLLTVTMYINTTKFNPIDEKWDIKFERDVIQHIKTPAFMFSTKSMNTAVTKVADLVARHPEFYFCKIEIK